MIEVEIYDKRLYEDLLSLERTASRVTNDPVNYDRVKEESKAKMIIRVGDYDWELTTGNHYKALKDGNDYIWGIEENPLRHSAGASITTFNLEGSRAVKSYLDSK